MRCLLLLAAFFAVCSAESELTRQINALGNPIDNIVKKAIEAARDIVANGLPSAGVPPLDPLVIQNQTFAFSNKDVQLSLALPDATMTHLAEFVVDKVTTSIFKMTVDLKLRVPVLRLEGDYAMDGKLVHIFPVMGNGKFHIELKNIAVGGAGKLKLASPPSVQNLNLDMTFESIDVQFEGLMGGGDLEQTIETIIDNNAKEVVDTVWAKAHDSVCKIAEDLINKALAGN